jgi:hypothetical protein
MCSFCVAEDLADDRRRYKRERDAALADLAVVAGALQYAHTQLERVANFRNAGPNTLTRLAIDEVANSIAVTLARPGVVAALARGREGEDGDARERV